MRARHLLPFLLAACHPGPVPLADLPLGDVVDPLSSSTEWGAALSCKPIPELPSLQAPRITISLDGLTLHLVDPATGYNRVFPVGVGTVSTDATDTTFGESHSMYPLLATGQHDFTIRRQNMDPCKTWWTDPEQGDKRPVFAGLPFMPWFGAYAIHGPIDNFRAANGGNLRRGFVSHGCIRMEAADVLEVYGRIRTLDNIPVHVQREPERLADGSRTNVPARWVGAECASDGDCDFAGGFCHPNRYSERGFCSAHCAHDCADRAGYPTTFCVADPDNPTSGICVEKVDDTDPDCRPFDHFVSRTLGRFNAPATAAAVCVPGSPGWIGDHCFTDDECQQGNRCAGAQAATPGVCTQSCSHFCPDAPGWPTTFCADEPLVGGCMRECTPASNASECAGGSSCAPRPRVGDPGTVEDVCVPG